MSKLDELIQQLCPKGVVWEKLENLSVVITKQTGFDYSQTIKPALLKLKSEESIPYIQTRNFEGKDFNFNTEYYVPKQIALKYPKIVLDEKCLLFSIVGASIGNVGLYPGNQTSFLGGAICVVKTKSTINVDFVYYYMSSKYGQKLINNKIKGAGQATITIDDIRNFEIPLPPLPVQEEIVRILDTFTESTNNLKEQIQTRRKQYGYYRDQLLDFEGKEGVEMKTLGDMCVLGTGSHNTQDGLSEGQYPFYTRGSEILYLNNFDYDETAIITAGDGAGVGKVFHYVQGKYALHQRAYRIVPDEKKVLTRFVYYYIGATFYNYIMRNSVSSSVVSIRRPMMVNYPIPHPPLAEQERIVNILDQFEASIANLESQLKQRKKQYEYYRNQLLDFKKKED